MQELLETMDGWRAEGAGIGRAVVVRTFGSAPRPEGAVLLRADDGRIAGSVSGGCVEGAAAEEIDRAREGRPQPGHPLRDQRRGGVGRGPRVRRDDRRARGAGARRRHGRRRPRARTRRRDDPPARTRRRRRSGATSRATGRRPPSASWSARTGRWTGRWAARPTTTRCGPPPRTRCCAGPRGRSTVGDRQVFVEAFPVRPRLVIVGAVEVARSLAVFAKELGYDGGRRGRAGVVRDPRAVPRGPRRPPRRRLAGRGRRRDRPRARTTPSRC